MCYENNVSIIIMLCNLNENGVAKCADYWNVQNLNNYYITKLNKQETEGLCIRHFNLYNKMTNESKNIIQYQLLVWEDHSALSEENFNKIIQLINAVDQFRNNNPTVVHCSAGVGRTGTFIAMYCLYHEIMRQIFIEKNSPEIVFSMLNLVRKIKEQRIISVQNHYQFALLYDFANYLLLKYNTENYIK